MQQAGFQAWFNRHIWNFDSRSGTVNLENPKTPINGWTLDQALGGNVSSSGRSVSYDASLTLSAVYRAVVIKSGLLSSLPFKLYKRTDKGREEVKDHPLSKMFAGKVNRKLTKTVFLERALGQYDMRGNHYALPIFDRMGQVMELQLLMTSDVEVFETRQGVAYKVKGVEGVLSSEQIIHVPNFGDDIIGKAVLDKACEDFSLMMNTRDYGDKWFGGGGKPQSILIPKGPTKNEQNAEAMENYKQAKKKFVDVALPYGWDLKELQVSPDQAEFLGTSQAGVANVSRWFGVPLNKLADMSAATRNNVESQGIEFLQDTMVPIGSKFENEYNVKLLRLASEEDMYLEFNWDAYLRADSATKATAYSTAIQNGYKTPNEVRKLNNDEAKEGGDDLMIQSGTMPIKDIQKYLMNKTVQQRQSLRKKIDKSLEEGKSPQLIIEELFT